MLKATTFVNISSAFSYLSSHTTTKFHPCILSACSHLKSSSKHVPEPKYYMFLADSDYIIKSKLNINLPITDITLWYELRFFHTFQNKFMDIVSQNMKRGKGLWFVMLKSPLYARAQDGTIFSHQWAWVTAREQSLPSKITCYLFT